MKINGLEGITIRQLADELKRGARFVVFEYVISIVILTFRRSSAIYYLRPGQSALGQGLPYILLTAVFGWWGIPFGLIYTPIAIIKDLAGGRDVTREVLNSTLGQKVREVQEAADPMQAAPVQAVQPAPPPAAAPACRACGAPLRPGAVVCGKCGEPVEAAPVQAVQPAPPPAAAPTCRACGAPLRPGAAVCGKCGEPVEALSAAAASTCPGCGAEVEQGWTTCPYCEADLPAGAGGRG